MSGIEQTEREVERGLEQVESSTERIEKEIDECEERIRRLEADIQAASSRGDSDAAAAMQSSLAEQQAERQRLGGEAEREADRLRELQREIKEVDAWNTELQRIIAGQAALEIDTSEVEHRTVGRERWVELQWERVQELLRRIGQMTI